MNENESENNKRASTISIPAKWGSQANCNSSNQQGSINNNNVGGSGSGGISSGGKAKSEKRVSYVGFEDQAENNGMSRSSVFSASASTSGHFSPITEVDQLKTSAWLSSQQQLLNNSQQSSSTTTGEVDNSKSSNNNFALLDEISSPSKIDATSSLPTNKQTGSGGSRKKIGAYLASKLYNLTNLASGGGGCSNSSSTNIHNQASGGGATPQTSNYSMSAPPSPLNKRASNSSCGGGGNGNGLNGGSGPGGSSKRQPLRQSIYDRADCQLPFYLSKDYGACDFILFVESTSVKQPPVMSVSAKSSMTTSSGGTLQTQIHHHHHHHASNIASSGNYSGNVTSGTASHHHHSSSMGGNSSQFGSSGANFAFGSGSGPIIIHLIAPNLQEKAAWMSDISQVSNLDELSSNSSLFSTSQARVESQVSD